MASKRSTAAVGQALLDLYTSGPTLSTPFEALSADTRTAEIGYLPCGLPLDEGSST
jgi:hypothetical protein